MIIALCGLIGAGKDTAADYLISSHGFNKLSFAGSLKDAISVVFNWDRQMLEGSTTESREWRETVDQWWANRLNIPHLTPRYVLQYFGTDLFRNHFHNDIWIASLENKLLSEKGNIVVTDCRFKNEIELFDKLNGHVARIKRGPEPEWFPHAVQAYDWFHHHSGHMVTAIEQLRIRGIHPSEYSWCGYSFKTIIENDGTLDDLNRKLKGLIDSI